MKIEKLTENKIRVIISTEDLDVNSFNVHSLMTKAIQTQEIFSDILKKAEKEVDFYTDGCKLLIEAFSSSEDVLVFTITKFLPEQDVKKKKLVVKRKTLCPVSKQVVCQFASLDSFGDFCRSFLSLSQKLAVTKLAKNVALYEWNGSYYLILRNNLLKEEDFRLFSSLVSEFGKFISCSEHFETKLLEHGKIVIKKDAIAVGLRFFV